MERKVFDSQTWPLRREYITNGDYELQRSSLQHWNRTILDINDHLIHSGLGGLTYTDQSREIEEIIDAVYALEQYLWDVEDRFQELDTQFYELINVPLQQLNDIRLEDITITNTAGIKSAGIGPNQPNAPKERISLLDLLNTQDGQIGTYYVKAFADAFQNKYDRGRTNERCATIEEFAEQFWELDDLQNYVNEAEKQAKVQKAKRIGANIATLSLYSLVEVLYGYDFIAQRELSYEEVRDRAFPALLSVAFNGMAAGQLLKSGLGGLEMVGSMYATEATSTLSGVASYEIAQELGFSDKGSTAAALISSMLTTNLVSYGIGKILSEKTSGIDVSKAEIRSNLFKATGELRTAEEISVYLKSLTEAEFASVVRQVNKKTLNEIKALDGLADEVVVRFGGNGATRGGSKIDDVLEGSSQGASSKIQFGSDTKSAQKLANQMNQRGWTESSVRSTVDTPYTTRVSINKATGNPATVYYTKEGSYVIIDDVTKAVVQVGDSINPSTWIPDPSIINPYQP